MEHIIPGPVLDILAGIVGLFGILFVVIVPGTPNGNILVTAILILSVLGLLLALSTIIKYTLLKSLKQRWRNIQR